MVVARAAGVAGVRGDHDPVRGRQQAHHLGERHLPAGHGAALRAPGQPLPAEGEDHPARPGVHGGDGDGDDALLHRAPARVGHGAQPHAGERPRAHQQRLLGRHGDGAALAEQPRRRRGELAPHGGGGEPDRLPGLPAARVPGAGVHGGRGDDRVSGRVPDRAGVRAAGEGDPGRPRAGGVGPPAGGAGAEPVLDLDRARREPRRLGAARRLPDPRRNAGEDAPRPPRRHHRPSGVRLIRRRLPPAVRHYVTGDRWVRWPCQANDPTYLPYPSSITCMPATRLILVVIVVLGRRGLQIVA